MNPIMKHMRLTELQDAKLLYQRGKTIGLGIRRKKATWVDLINVNLETHPFKDLDQVISYVQIVRYLNKVKPYEITEFYTYWPD